MGIKKLTLADLDAQATGPIWCVNSAAASKYELSGNVVLDIPHTNGAKSDPLVIRQTWLPIDVSARFGRARVLQDFDLGAAHHVVCNECCTRVLNYVLKHVLLLI
jgi:hypothetical protein